MTSLISDRWLLEGELRSFDGHHIMMADPEGNEVCVGAASV
ncbi:hypothetical protein [Streptomyces sp. NBC_00286]|nr:hypothetical protein [Streptomyces sp. NBC_00286]